MFKTMRNVSRIKTKKPQRLFCVTAIAYKQKNRRSIYAAAVYLNFFLLRLRQKQTYYKLVILYGNRKTAAVTFGYLFY